MICVSRRCSVCRDMRVGLMTTHVYRLPDILIIYLKRFQTQGQQRAKITMKIDFPLEGLDMSAYLYKGNGMNGEPVNREGTTLYDLYAVANHFGHLGGGHYTAFVKCLTSGSGISSTTQSVTVSQLLQQSNTRTAMDTISTVQEARWYAFDDDVVEEIPASAVVTEHAYVLFYRRQQMSGHNFVTVLT